VIVHARQNIGFGLLSPITFTTTPVDLSATSTSGLAVTFTSATQSVCTVSDSAVSVSAIGICSITANQVGNSIFSPAPSVTETFNVTAPLALPGRPVIKATSPFKGRIRITLRTPASSATNYQYSLNSGKWLRLGGKGPYTLSRIRRATISVRVRGANTQGDGPTSNAVRVRVRRRLTR
jgi:hypothetical protein